VVPRDITDIAEREDQYLSGKGVCAGPQNMIDELITTLMDGKPLAYPKPALGPWVADIPAALDYGLLGIQVYATTFSTWMKMTRAYSRIHEVLERAPRTGSGALAKLRTVIERDWEIILPVRSEQPEQQAWSENFARRMFNNAQTGVRGFAPEDSQDLGVALTPPAGLSGRNAAGALSDLFASLDEPKNAPFLQEIALHLLEFLRYERCALKSATAETADRQPAQHPPHPSQGHAGRGPPADGLRRRSSGGGGREPSRRDHRRPWIPLFDPVGTERR
jgi:hypothetical protein